MNTRLQYKQTLTISLLSIFFFFFFFVLSKVDVNLPLYFSAWKYETGLFAPYQLVSYQFIHADLSHLFFNLMCLIPTGILLESKTKSKIFYYFICSGIFAGIFHLLLYKNTLPLVGASGSIWGLSVLLALAYRSNLLKIFTLLLFLIEIYKAFFFNEDGVAHWCHIGGALAGLLIYCFEKKFLTKNYSM